MGQVDDLLYWIGLQSEFTGRDFGPISRASFMGQIYWSCLRVQFSS